MSLFPIRSIPFTGSVRFRDLIEVRVQKNPRCGPSTTFMSKLATSCSSLPYLAQSVLEPNQELSFLPVFLKFTIRQTHYVCYRKALISIVHHWIVL